MPRHPATRMVLIAVCILAVALFSGYLPRLWRTETGHHFGPVAVNAAISIGVLGLLFRLFLSWRVREFLFAMLGLVLALILAVAVAMTATGGFYFPAFAYYSVALLIVIGVPWCAAVGVASLARKGLRHGQNG